MWYASPINKLPPPRELLYRLYVTENLTADQIAQRVGYSRSRVFALLEAAGIPRNKRRVEVAPNQREDPTPLPRPITRTGRRIIPDADWLRARYWDDNQNVTDIAKELGVNPNSITRVLHEYGIPIKPRYLCYADRHKGRGDWSKALRTRIMHRDGDRCRLCGRTDHLEVHHIVPLRLGGKTNVENGITLCADCHTSVGFHEVNMIGQLLELRGASREG